MLGDLNVILAPVALVLTALAILVADLILPDDGDPRPPAILALVGLAVAGWATLRAWGAPAAGFTRAVALPGGGEASLSMVRMDGFAVFAGAVVLVATAGTVLLAWDRARREPTLARAELYVLLLLAASAMMLAGMANDLVLLFLAIETFSIALYVLAGLLRERRPSLEAAMKYFVLGAFAGGFLLYGTALVYATSGSTGLDPLAAHLQNARHSLPAMAYLGLGLILVGLGFKVAMVPFHQWTPDVYEGAPTPITAFMSAATKAAAFAALARVLWVGFAPLSSAWLPIVGALAVLTMFVGNLAALVQADLKRMLAFSAIAHAGYLLVALASGPEAATGALLYYLMVYAVLSLGAFGVLVALPPRGPEGREATRLEDLRGLMGRQPILALALSVLLLGLTGLPPTAGFLAKWYIFEAAVGAGQTTLAALVVINSVIAAFYYLRPVILMILPAPEAEPAEAPFAVAAPSGLVVGLSVLAIGLALLVSAPLARAARQAVLAGPPAGDAAPGAEADRVIIPVVPSLP